ncbi:MAG TPA: RNA-binding protein [Bacillota bacterium]|nr:RNA-binding protein [Bacillota bacterium]HPT88336.1 RNA-binding protein [Bacillota bacterium]
MSKTLYVGNLPWGATKEDLAALFAEHTEVISSRIITEPGTGRSRGFGFIEIDDNEDVQEIINQVNGKDMGGREIIVNEAKPRQNKM